MSSLASPMKLNFCIMCLNAKFLGGKMLGSWLCAKLKGSYKMGVYSMQYCCGF